MLTSRPRTLTAVKTVPLSTSSVKKIRIFPIECDYNMSIVQCQLISDEFTRSYPICQLFCFSKIFFTQLLHPSPVRRARAPPELLQGGDSGAPKGWPWRREGASSVHTHIKEPLMQTNAPPRSNQGGASEVRGSAPDAAFTALRAVSPGLFRRMSYSAMVQYMKYL